MAAVEDDGAGVLLGGHAANPEGAGARLPSGPYSYERTLASLMEPPPRASASGGPLEIIGAADYWSIPPSGTRRASAGRAPPRLGADDNWGSDAAHREHSSLMALESATSALGDRGESARAAADDDVDVNEDIDGGATLLSSNSAGIHDRAPNPTISPSMAAWQARRRGKRKVREPENALGGDYFHE